MFEKLRPRAGWDSRAGEEVRGDLRSKQPLRLPAAGQVDVALTIRGKLVERAILAFPVVVVGSRYRRLLPDDNRGKTSEIRERKRFQKKSVGDAEDGGIGADAQRQCQRRDQREAEIAAQNAQPVAKVLGEAHGLLRRRGAGCARTCKIKSRIACAAIAFDRIAVNRAAHAHIGGSALDVERELEGKLRCR